MARAASSTACESSHDRWPTLAQTAAVELPLVLMTVELREAIIEVLAGLLVADYQRDAATTVGSPRGGNRDHGL